LEINPAYIEIARKRINELPKRLDSFFGKKNDNLDAFVGDKNGREASQTAPTNKETTTFPTN
jgi:hypothetical protein